MRTFRRSVKNTIHGVSFPGEVGPLPHIFVSARYRSEDQGKSEYAKAYSSNKVLLPEDVVVFALE